jgi:hypothetical protein
MGRQVGASHFCIHLRHDLYPCDLRPQRARLIGIEYITSDRRFPGLPDDEKRLSHSRHYEVESGILVKLGPGIRWRGSHSRSQLRKSGQTV